MKLQSDKSLKVKNQESSNQKKKQFRIKKLCMPGIMGLVKGKFVFNEDALEKMHKEMIADIE